MKYDIEKILEMYEDDYTPSSKVPGPRNMKLAQVPRSEMDNFNTPDLEQSPDSFLRPGETLEDFDVEFRRPNAQGGRIGFDNGGKTSKVKTNEFQYPVKFKNRNTGEIETVYKKEPIDYEARGKRVSTKVNTYKTALDDFQKQVDDAIQSKNVSKLPKSFAQFLKDKGLKSGTYFALLDNNEIPRIETDTSKIRLNFANSLIKDANQNLKFINAENLFKNAGFTSKEYKSLYATKQLLKLDKAEDKVAKGFKSLFASFGAAPKAVDLFNPVEKIAKITGLNNGIVSKRLTTLDIKKQSPELHKVFKILGNTNFQKNISANFPDVTLTQLMTQPKSFFADYAQSKTTNVRKGRLDKATTLAGEGVADINAAQKNVVKLLNDYYKKNPEELLGNTKLRNLLDLTLEDGEIVKKNKYVTDDDFKKLIQDKKGLFTMDHVDEVQFEKLSTEFPIFKQLTTYNTNSGLIKSMKAYMSKNQNSKDPAVQNKIKKQVEFLEDLKLRVDTPTGRVGSKEVLAAVDRKAGVLPNFLAQLRALNIKLPAKAKAAVLGISGGLGATTLATAGPIEETGSNAMDTAKTVAAGTAGAATLGTKTGRKAVGKFAAGAFGPLGLLAFNTGLGVDPTQSVDRLGLGLEAALLKDSVKGTIGATKGMKNRALQKGIQRILNAGMSVPTALKVARYASPLGIASLAGEAVYNVGKLGYEDQKRFNALSPEEQAAERAEQEKFAFDIEGS